MTIASLSHRELLGCVQSENAKLQDGGGSCAGPMNNLQDHCGQMTPLEGSGPASLLREGSAGTNGSVQCPVGFEYLQGWRV